MLHLSFCQFDSATAKKDQRTHPKEGVADDDHSCHAPQAHCGKEGVNLWPHPLEGLPRARGHRKACSRDQVSERQVLMPLIWTTASACRGSAVHLPHDCQTELGMGGRSREDDATFQPLEAISAAGLPKLSNLLTQKNVRITGLIANTTSDQT